MNNNPVIIIPGIGQSKLVLCDDNGNRIKNAWPFELDTKALIDELKGSIMKLMLFRKDAGFSDRIADVARDITAPLALNRDGTSKNNIKAVEFRKSVAECTAEEKKFIYKMAPVDMLGSKISEDKLFYFAYNFLGDISAVAAELDSFVTFVTEKTGAEKVDFIVYGTAGAVLKAYLKDYSVKSVTDKIICVAAALDGTTLAADIYENRLELENPLQLLSSLGGKASTLASMAGMIPQEVINNIISKCLAVAKESILDSCTSLFALVPSARFENALAAMNADPAFTEKVRAQADYTAAFIKAAEKYNLYIICGCGKALPPVIQNADTDSDGIVDTASASAGASHNVWMFRNQAHDSILYNDSVMSLIMKILSNESTDDYPGVNGARNVRRLRNSLLPKLREAGKPEAEAIEAEYNALIGAVVIENDNEIKKLEEKIESIIA